MAVHRSALAKAADFSAGAHTVPRKAPHVSLSATLCLTPWKEPCSFLVGHIRLLVAKKQLPITKGRSSDSRLLMREKDTTKLLIDNEPRKQSSSFFT